MNPDAVVTIEAIRMLPVDDRRVRGCFFDLPAAGHESDIYSFNLIGWILGRQSRVVAVDILHAGVRLGRATVDLDRPDIVKAFPDAPEARRCGFRTSISVVPLPLRAEVTFQAVFADDSRMNFGVVTVRRKSIASGYSARLQPLLVSTLGRTGSTWVVRVLGEHPQIAAYRPFEYEPRIASYWLEVLRTVAEPASIYQGLDGQIYGPDWWVGARRSTPLPGGNVLDPAIHRRLGRVNVEAAAGFALQRVDDFYTEAARLQEKSGAVYFAEKCQLGSMVPDLASDLYSGAREIVLVRDFRDMVCSILAFNKKLGYASFGRQRVDSDEKFIQDLRGSALLTRDYFDSRGGRAYLLRYEDLILAPESTLRALLEYLGLDSGDEAIRGTLARAHARTPELQEGHRTAASPEASIGRWRRDLDEKLRGECNAVFGDVLRHFGYND